ncbi:MAG: ACP S-malonyltransferase [Candidatus Limnocylindria bacterium]
MTRALVAFPGRGAYGASSLGLLRIDHPWVRRAEELRGGYELPSLAELDAADRFDPRLHLRPANASALTFLLGLLDAERIAADHEVVAVVGNSMGWYTALAASGALAFDDAFRLVQDMALLQEQPLPEDGPGGQVIYPLTDADWRPSPGLAAAVDHALAAGNGSAHRSVDLGGFTVLAGTESGVDRLLAALPQVRVGERAFPVRLALHGPHHTPLVEHVAAAARRLLGDLDWREPNVTLVDGRGVRWTPWSTDPTELASYTLDEQLVTPFRFAASLRVALREHAPDVVVLPGPGNSLGGICAQLVVAEGYHGIRSRVAFEKAQAGAAPILLAMRR